MSEDRLEEALRQMNAEDVDAGQIETARARVWKTITSTGGAVCAEFRDDFQAYLANELGSGRRLLVEDHLSRCPSCRARIAEMKGDRTVAPRLRQGYAAGRSTRWVTLTAVAALLIALVYVGRDTIDGLMAPAGPRATIASVEGDLYRLTGLSAEARSAKVEAGAVIGDRESIRTGPGARAILRLPDGSTVDVNERTELFVAAAWSGQSIHLQRGDIIVKAAKQRRGRLRVLTRDSIASVRGTIFAVSAGMGGSVVSVIEGSVAVDQPGKAVVLRPGDQAASIPRLASSVTQAVAWSPDAAYYLEVLASLAKIERELANFPAELRTNPALLPYLPAGVGIYGAVPNPGITISRALALAEEQSPQNATFGAWWNSETGQNLRQIADRLQSVSPFLGDEIVFCVSVGGTSEPVPMLMARVQPGKRADLADTLQQIFAEGEAASYSISDDVIVVSDSASNLAWAVAHLGQGAGSPFAAAIGARYQRGVGWLMGMDASSLAAMAAEDDAPVELASMVGLKYVFLEQRAAAGPEENEATFTFQSPGTGMASWLASAGSGGATEYLPADALVAGSVSTREPGQLFEELTAMITQSEPDFARNLAELDETLGAGFVKNFTAAIGTEAALAVTGLSTSGPTWVLAIVANNPWVIDSSLVKLVEAFNAELGPDEQSERIVFQQETANGRTWNTLKPGGLPISVTWTYDAGYMVAGSDRAAAERAIATRTSGAQLVWSSDFVEQLPSSAGLHPSAFAWLNTKVAAFAMLSELAPSPAVTELIAGRDSILVVFNGSAEQIHAASRTRISGLIVDLMLIENLDQVIEGRQ